MRLRNLLAGLRRRWLLVVSALAVLVVCVPVTAIVANAPLRDFIYREVSYALLTDRLVGDERDPAQIALRLNEFIAENVYPGGGPVLDTNSWNDLVRGIGWCDQDAWMLGTLLATRDIHGKIVFLEGQGGAPQHTVAEVLLDGEWRVFDPLYGLAFHRTYGDLSRDPSSAIAHPVVQALPPATRTQLEAFFLKLYSNPEDPGRWTSLVVSKYGTRPRRAARAAVRLYVDLFGSWGANRIQDLYLGLLPDRLVALDDAIRVGNRPVFHTEEEDPALFLFYRARNYHLYGRADEAERLYGELVERHPSSYYAEKTAYFAAHLEWKLRRDPQAALDQFAAFIRRYPNSTWLPLAHDTLGGIYEELGDRSRAIEHYRVASANEWVHAASRLKELNFDAEGAQLRVP